MYNSDTELLFPIRVIPSLAGFRGAPWQELIERVSSANVISVEPLAFVLMMVKMGGCVGCNADSFRAMRGCTACSRQTIRRFRGSDEDLVELFNSANREMEQFTGKRNPG